MNLEYLIDFDGVILDSQSRFEVDMKGNTNFDDWLNYLSSIEWYHFLRECNEIDGSLSTLQELQKYKKLRAIITAIHSFEEGRQKLIYLRDNHIEVPVLYVLPEQKKSDIFIPKRNTVLVDDKLNNCIDWNNSGGVSLLFDCNDNTGSKEIIKSLKQIL